MCYIQYKLCSERYIKKFFIIYYLNSTAVGFITNILLVEMLTRAKSDFFCLFKDNSE